MTSYYNVTVSELVYCRDGASVVSLGVAMRKTTTSLNVFAETPSPLLFQESNVAKT